MITLSTLPTPTPSAAPRRGFALFVDGRLRAELSDGDAGDATSDAPGDAPGDEDGRGVTRPATPPVTGGDAMDLKGGQLVLCGRSDRDPQRFYSGLLSNLALFSQVRAFRGACRGGL